MYHFHVHIHRRDESVESVQTISLANRQLEALSIETGPSSFQIEFDRASEILATLPRMFIEPDGSFVWTGEADTGNWQVDGVLYDAGAGLAYVEMSGCCPPDQFDQFLAALGWPAATVMFQLVEAGIFIDEHEFRRIAVS